MFGKNDDEMTEKMIDAINNMGVEMNKTAANITILSNAINDMSKRITVLSEEIKRKNEIDDARRNI